MAKMISIDLEDGNAGKWWVVLTCPCGHEDSGERRNERAVHAAVLRIVDHTRNCAESRDSVPVSRENASGSIEPR